MWGGRQSIVYTAQTGTDARQKLMRDQVPMIEGSAVKAAVRQIYRANGTEAVVFRNGSRIDPVPNTPSAGHGRTIDMAVLDEVRFDTDDTREAALLPAMITRPESQLWVVSTAGDATSVYFRKKIEEGRRMIEAGEKSSRAFFDWSAPDDADVEDREVWWRTIPALIGGTITEEALQHRLDIARSEDKENSFAQEYLCQWKVLEESAIPARFIQRVLDPKATPAGRLVFGIDVALDRSSASVVVADETGNVELIDWRPGVTWVVDRVLDLWRKHRGQLVVDGYSPANSLVDRLEAGGIPVKRYATRDMAAACGVFYDAVLEESIRIRPSTALEAALNAAKRKSVAAGWLWSRTTLAADLSPLFAATLAYYHATNRKEAEPTRSAIF